MVSSHSYQDGEDAVPGKQMPGVKVLDANSFQRSTVPGSDSADDRPPDQPIRAPLTLIHTHGLSCTYRGP